MPRQTTGCWTCRARKKKCDDTRPVCSACKLRHITCYGYGFDKPAWLDGADGEKQMLRTMKIQCKAAYGQRRSARAKQKSTTAPHQIKTSIQCRREDVWSGHQASNRGSSRVIEHSDNYPEPITPASNLQFASTPSPASTTSRDSNRPFQFSHSDRDLGLVMYYLDHIFPRLCPFFDYNPGDDGRGWLLCLFLRTKPLCALAVCLSACDKAQLVLGRALTETSQPHHDLEMQHIQIAKDLRDHLDRLVDVGGSYQMSAAVEALACVMHLVLFELWIPRNNDMKNDWIMHLDAASVLLHSVARPSSQQLGSQMTSSNIEDHFPVDDLSGAELAAFYYFYAQYTYFLTHMAASFGLTLRSRLSLDRTQSIFHRKQNKLKGVIGCEDWVLMTILDIVVLKEWKSEMQNAGMLSLRELVRRAEEIELRLTEGLAALSSRTTPGLLHEQQQDMLTSTFTNGALVFLHAVTSGFKPNLLEIKHGVLRTLEALEYMRHNSTINIPSWPYCVAGCLSIESLHPRFRALYPKPVEGTHPLVNTKWSIDIMEESWRLRKGQGEAAESCDMGTIMTSFGTRILLIG